MFNGKRTYFLSDFHLGAPDAERSLVREKRVIAFLDQAAKDAKEIILLGDLFDFWFEWKKVVPRGYTRLLGKLAELTDRGIPVHLFLGNHDMWAFDYLSKETGVIIHREPVVREMDGKRFLIGHGDGLGPGDHGYKFLKKVFRNPVCQWLFARLHPNFAIGLGDFWSGRSRNKSYENDRQWLGEDKEWLVVYCRERLAREHFDFMVFGHRHLPVDMEVKPFAGSLTGDPARAMGAAGSLAGDPARAMGASGSPAGDPARATGAAGSLAGDPARAEGVRYINLGDWISHFTYAVFDGEGLRLMRRSGDGSLEQDQQITGGPAR